MNVEFVFVFLLNYLPGLLTWHTNYSTNQLKLKAMPFLEYLWSVAARH